MASPYIYKLPQELLDIIYDLAYSEAGNGSTLISRGPWEERENLRAGQRNHFPVRDPSRHAMIRPFPDPVVSRWIVSKRWLLLAANVWIGNRHWNDSDIDAASNLSPLFTWNTSLVLHFAQTLTTSLGHRLKRLHVAHAMPNLRNLHLCVAKADFYEHGTMKQRLRYRRPWQHLTDEQLADTSLYKGLAKLRGLRAFSITPQPAAHSALQLQSDRDEEKQTWLYENSEALERLQRPIVTQPKARVYDERGLGTGSTTPLYLGSRVALHTSQILERVGRRGKGKRGTRV